MECEEEASTLMREVNVGRRATGDSSSANGVVRYGCRAMGGREVVCWMGGRMHMS